MNDKNNIAAKIWHAIHKQSLFSFSRFEPMIEINTKSNSIWKQWFLHVVKCHMRLRIQTTNKWKTLFCCFFFYLQCNFMFALYFVCQMKMFFFTCHQSQLPINKSTISFSFRNMSPADRLFWKCVVVNVCLESKKKTIFDFIFIQGHIYKLLCVYLVILLFIVSNFQILFFGRCCDVKRKIKYIKWK